MSSAVAGGPAAPSAACGDTSDMRHPSPDQDEAQAAGTLAAATAGLHLADAQLTSAPSGPDAGASTSGYDHQLQSRSHHGGDASIAPQQQQQAKKQRKQRQRQRLSHLVDAKDVEALLGIDDADVSAANGNSSEEELVARLQLQLKGLSHKQQALYGIADAPGGGRQTYLDTWRQRHAERREMVASLKDPAIDPRSRMGCRTSYILKWRKTLFSCPTCWLLRGLCVCGRMQRFKPKTRVVVHVHHGEWGSASNSGCILPTSLDGAEMLLYSHPEHDDRLQQVLADPHYTTALLWPGADALLPSELAAIAEQRTEGRVAVVALDATWANARRMHGFFPKGTLTVRLPPETTLRENQLSLLRPVRKYRGDLASGRVSTVEAVASLLYELEGDEAMYRGLLDNLRVKVDGCRAQKNRELVYGTDLPHQPVRPRQQQRQQQQQQQQQEQEGQDGPQPGDDSEHSADGGP